MTLRVQNNITAMNAHKNLQTADTAMAKSLERLSSGYRINRAADDAAGLSISSGFRADIASFKVASRNTSEANAMLQVAEGGMEQIENMLTRLKELATQAASSNVGDAERTKINAEGNKLISEIDRIANSTKYGSTNLLDGTFGAAQAAGTYSSTGVTGVQVYGDMTNVYSVNSAAVAAANSANLGDLAMTVTGFNQALSAGNYVFSMNTAGATGYISLGNGVTTEKASFDTTLTSAGQTLVFDNMGVTITVNTAATAVSLAQAFCGSGFIMKDTGVTNLNVEGATSGTYQILCADAGYIKIGNGSATQQIGNIVPGTAAELNFTSLGVTFSIGTEYTENDLEGVSFVVSSSGNGSTFQIGSQNNADNRISVSISSVSTSSLNSGLVADQLDNQTEAQSMLTTIDSAISALATARGNIGANMNRLSYAAANLATTIENTQSAESIIRDVDMADEMTSFTKNQILVQAGTAMLSQANQSPQMLLSLLQG